MNDLRVTERNQMPNRLIDPHRVIKNDIAHPLTDDAEIMEDNTGLFSF